MNCLRLATLCIVASLLLCACDRPLQGDHYRIEVQEVSDHGTSLARKYLIETASLRKIVLSDRSGSNSTSVGPNSMTSEQTALAEVTVTVELQELDTQAHVTIKMQVETSSITSRSEETMTVPSTTDLASMLTEYSPSEQLDEATTLLRLSAGEQYLQVTVE